MISRSLIAVLFAIPFISLGQKVNSSANPNNQAPITLDTTVVLDEDSVSASGNKVISSSTEIVPLPYILKKDSVGDSLRIDTIRLNNLVGTLLADSLYWISVDTNFAIFDSMSVNPYKVEGDKFKDTVTIALYDSVDTDSSRSWSMPLGGVNYVTSKFGMRHYKWHYGTDLRLAIGDTIYATFDGVVRINKYNRGGYGYYVLLRHHNALETLYGHMSKQLVRVGQHVKAGQPIGLGGNTGRSSGPHLHFEVRFQGNAIDPSQIFEFDSVRVRTPEYQISPKDFAYIKEAKRAMYHRVRSGDTLSHIARRYRVSINQICRLNGIRRSTILRIGRRLRVR